MNGNVYGRSSSYAVFLFRGDVNLEAPSGPDRRANSRAPHAAPRGPAPVTIRRARAPPAVLSGVHVWLENLLGQTKGEDDERARAHVRTDALIRAHALGREHSQGSNMMRGLARAATLDLGRGGEST